MGDLSDFKRVVHEPLWQRNRELQAEVASWQDRLREAVELGEQREAERDAAVRAHEKLREAADDLVNICATLPAFLTDAEFHAAAYTVRALLAAEALEMASDDISECEAAWIREWLGEEHAKDADDDLDGVDQEGKYADLNGTSAEETGKVDSILPDSRLDKWLGNA